MHGGDVKYKRSVIAMTRFISVLLSILQLFSMSLAGLFGRNELMIDTQTKYQAFEGFGASACWWAQTIDDDEQAREIAELLYDKENGLGLEIFRYNIGAGEAENPDSRIWNTARRAESFYVYNKESGEYEYDFTRDKNARRVLDYAVEYGAKRVILFCNSAHFSMTKSGHASGGLTGYSSNLPKENYAAFVDYVLTIADWFVEQGYPVYAVAPINEPQWEWGGEWVGQEGCHFEPDEAIELLEMFAVEMKKRNSPYKLSGPECGEMTWYHYQYVEKFFESEILSEFCDTFSGHSYWMDTKSEEKQQVGDKFKESYPDKKYEMTEWCELPLRIDGTSIESGLYMARVMVDDLTKMNAVSWQFWAAVNGDGLLDLQNGELIAYNRYYALKQFSSFIKTGMTRVRVVDNFRDSSALSCVAFADDEETVVVLVNSGNDAKSFTLRGKYENAEIYVTDRTKSCEKTYDGTPSEKITLTPKSITTLCLK